MSASALTNRLRHHRRRLGLSQQRLAELAGVSRQAVIAIEGGRRVPATSLALRLAGALRCGVEDLFSLSVTEGLSARLAPAPIERAGEGSRSGRARVVMGEVGGTWVAHRLPADPTIAADGVIATEASARTAVVRLLADPDHLRQNVIVAGCAPVLGLLSQRAGRRFSDARATWMPSGSLRALDLLQAGLVHVAGVHLSSEASGEDNVSAIRRMFPNERMLLINLTRWRQGFVVSSGNPMAIGANAPVLRPGLRFARREEGAAAHKLMNLLLARAGIEEALVQGPFAAGHAEVAQLVRCGAADVGVAIEGVALAAGLGFVPLTEERFDLVVPAALAESAPVSRLLHTLEDPAFRTEIGYLPGYDSEMMGHATTVEAA
jgi:molybdate-binding protein/DNA-binding XRE family transcriptional regulator